MNASSIVMLLMEKLFECDKIKSLILIDVLFCSLFLAGGLYIRVLGFTIFNSFPYLWFSEYNLWDKRPVLFSQKLFI